MENVNSITTGKMIGFFTERQIEKIKKIKTVVLQIFIWSLVFGTITGAFIIVSGFESTSTSMLLSKLTGTLLLISCVALVNLFCFSCIENEDKAVQGLSILGIGSSILWFFLWFLTLWGVFDIYARCGGYRYSCYSSYSVLGTITMLVSYISALGVFGAATLNIYEGKKRNVIRPLKLTAFVCLCFVELHSIVTLLFLSSTSSSSTTTFYLLSGLAGCAWIVMVIVAHVISKQEKNEQLIEKLAAKNAAAPAAPKTDEELRAEIEEKVRREMIEKEIRAKLEKEMSEKN